MHRDGAIEVQWPTDHYDMTRHSFRSAAATMDELTRHIRQTQITGTGCPLGSALTGQVGDTE